jgi:type IV secretion system protein VirB9
MVYNPDDVFKYVGYYGYQASIELSQGEAVETISMGDTVAWQVVPSGNRIFIKPMEANATTNMTLITNKRTYYFELHAEEIAEINDPKMVFTVRFLYPDESSSSPIQQVSTSLAPDADDPDNRDKLNFNYTLSGSELVAPLKIFDDGEFTYFEFRNKNAEIPAFFTVDSDNRESVVNYRVAGKYIVVEKVSQQFTLRHGSDITCVFNENAPLIKKKKQ